MFIFHRLKGFWGEADFAFGYPECATLLICFRRLLPLVSVFPFCLFESAENYGKCDHESEQECMNFKFIEDREQRSKTAGGETVWWD